MKHIIFAFLAVFLLISCAKENKMEDTDSTELKHRSERNSGQSASVEEFEGYEDDEFNIILNTTAVSLLQYAKNPSITKIIYQKAALECSDDYEVLIHYVNKSIIPDFRSNMYTTIQSNLSSIIYDSEVERIIGNWPRDVSLDTSVFDIIVNGDQKVEIYFPHIFIPFLENFNENELPSAIAVGSSDDDILYGYDLNNTNGFKTILIDENFAKENLVWVIAMNENIVAEEYLISYIDCTEGNISPISPIEPREYSGCKDYFVDSIYLKEPLEKWWQGQSDVTAIVAFMFPNGNEAADPTHVYLRDVPRRHLNKWLAPKRSMVTGGESVLCPDEILDWILYERDAVKKKWKRDFNPWKGSPWEYGNKTYTYFSKEDQIFQRTINTYGRWYWQLPNNYAQTRDRLWDYHGFAGKCITSSALIP